MSRLFSETSFSRRAVLREGFCRNPRGIFLNKFPGEFCGRFFGGSFGLLSFGKTGGKTPPQNQRQNSNQNLGASWPKSALQGSALDQFLKVTIRCAQPSRPSQRLSEETLLLRRGLLRGFCGGLLNGSAELRGVF